MRKLVTIFKQILTKGSNSKKSTNHAPIIIPRDEHKISRRQISQAALKVLYRLHKAGYSAYLVGGSVRDLLLGLSPKDFDVVTDALPEQIQKLFSNSFIIGRRFRLVHVRFGKEIVEVATFRGNTQNHSARVKTPHGVLLRDNVYGTIEDDVWRRDFTVNALYYNIADFSVVDYTGGMADLEKRCLRVIGEPAERYREDPARMLRAIRLAGKLDFEIEAESAQAIKEFNNLLPHVPTARLFDKMLKIFHSGKSFATFKLMLEYDVLSILFPAVAESLKEDPNRTMFMELALKNTDERIAQNKSINSAFLFAVFLWYAVQSQKMMIQEKEELNGHQAFHAAMAGVIANQLQLISIPRRFTIVIREIWHLQFYFENLRPKRIYKIYHHQRFRAAYDFLMLRSAIEKNLQPECEWWTSFQEGDEEQQQQLINSRFAKPKRRRRKKKRDSDDQSVSGTGE
jgi:poly(A) polymerase